MELFHVHTHRCMHASDENDEEYIVKAIQMGATHIYFTDHAPFPGDPFRNRMGINQLEEYVSALDKLRHAYRWDLQVCVGLEIEYLPSYLYFYEELSKIKELDLLMIGQHFYEIAPDTYSFSLKPTPKEYAEGNAIAMIEGINTGMFSHVAHPDRMFRKYKQWCPEMDEMANDIIQAATDKNVTLEKNISSMQRKFCYWEQFWEHCSEDTKIIYGLDAHATGELEDIFSDYINSRSKPAKKTE